METSGNLKRCCGKTLPVKVRPTANAQCILEKGVTKHANHYKKVHEGLEYVLLYPDHSEVVNFPGTTNEFILVECVNSVRVLAIGSISSRCSGNEQWTRTHGWTRLVAFVGFNQSEQCPQNFVGHNFHA